MIKFAMPVNGWPTDEELDVSYPMYDPSNGKPIVAEVDPPEIVQVPTGLRPSFENDDNVGDVRQKPAPMWSQPRSNTTAL